MGFSDALDSFFCVSERGSTIGNEVKSGVVTFLTMSYILLVNPQILGAAGLEVEVVVTATALSSTLACLIVGLGANMPFGMSPGMGLNAYLVFSQVLGLHVSVEKALAGCAMAAAVVAVLAVIRALALILGIVPDSIKLAVVVGMGLLLTFIGMQTSKIVVPDKETMVTMGDLLGLEPVLAISGLAIISALHYRNVKGSIIIGVLATAIGYFVATKSWPTQFVALPHLQLFKLDFSDLISSSPDPAAWSAVLAYTLVMVFDVGGAMFGLGNLAGLVREGHVPGGVVTYLAAAAGTAVGALIGTTPIIIAAESAVGIKEGGRTGLVSLTVGGCFLSSIFLAPFLRAIPQVATAPVLVLVGAMMMGESTHIDWSCMMTAVPAFLTIVIQPFTFSIANGIYAGLVMAALLWLLTGQFLEVCGRAKAAAEELVDDLETPILNGSYAQEQAALVSQLAGVADTHAHAGGSAQQGAINMPARGQVASPGSFVGSLRAAGSRSTPYERGSFSMYINTFGSHTSPSGGRGSFLQGGGGTAPTSEEPEH